MTFTPLKLYLGMAGLMVLAGALSACGMPQATVADAPSPAARVQPELLGAPGSAETVLAEAPPLPAPARRAGWGTMAPIPNPGGERSVRWASASAPYRVIGPAAPDSAPERALAAPVAPLRARPPSAVLVRARLEPGPHPSIRVEAAPSSPAKGRVRHLIMPAAQR